MSAIIGLAEVFPSGAWTINRCATYRPQLLAEYAAYQRRTWGARVFLFRPSRSLSEVRAILFRWMTRRGITPADTVSQSETGNSAPYAAPALTAREVQVD